MHKIALPEAQLRLAELIEEVAAGQEVVIIGNNGSSFKIVQLIPEEPLPKFGSAKGLIEISDDFDEPLEDFKDYL